MEKIESAETAYRLVRLPQYERDLKGFKRLEPRLHEVIRASLEREVAGGDRDEIPGTGGWVKGRAASPSRNLGKSGGFRFIYLLFQVEHDIYLFTVYDHRRKTDLTPEERKQLKALSEAIKGSYRSKEKP